MSLKYFYLAIIAFAIIGCGGEGTNSNTQTKKKSVTNIKEAVFIDSAVEGLYYKSANGISGYTDKNGVFKYLEGSEVSFWAGNVLVGKGKPVNKPKNIKAVRDKIITPFELASLKDKNISNPKVIKVAKFLISLDRDNNASNGIEIDLSKLKEQNKTINLEKDNLEDIIKDSLIVNDNKAKEHLEKSLKIDIKQNNENNNSDYNETEIIKPIEKNNSESNNTLLPIDNNSSKKDNNKMDLNTTPPSVDSNGVNENNHTIAIPDKNESNATTQTPDLNNNSSELENNSSEVNATDNNSSNEKIEKNITISGEPKTQIFQYSPYIFKPSTNIQNPTFSIENKPSWAEFNTTTGELSGTPRVDGNFSNIIISVSNGQDRKSLPLFNIKVKPAINIAKVYGEATQGTTADSGYSWYYPASNAIDGKEDTFNHTRADSSENWLQVKIPKNTKVYNIRVLNRQDGYQDRLNGAKVYLLNSSYAGAVNESDVVGTLTGQKEWQDINLTNPKVANYLLIKLPNEQNLHIAEVEIYGKLPDKPEIKDKNLYVISSYLLDAIHRVEAIDYQGDELEYSINSDRFGIYRDNLIYSKGKQPEGLYEATVEVSDGKNVVDKNITILVSQNLAKNYGTATISRDYWDDEDGNKTKDSYPEIINNRLSDEIYTKDDGKTGSWVQIELPQEADIYAMSLYATKYEGSTKGVSVYVLNKSIKDANFSLDSSKKIGSLQGEKSNIITLKEPKRGKYILIKKDNNGWFIASEVRVYGNILKQEPVVKNSDNNITIKGLDEGDVVTKIDAIDYQQDSLTYSINGDVPFTIDNKGNIIVNGGLEIKSYKFDVLISDGEHSTTYHITINSQTNTKDLVDARDDFENKAKAFNQDSNLDELINSYLNYAHQKAKMVYENFMQTPLDESVWSWIEGDEYLKEGLYASRFPANPYSIKNLADFKAKFSEENASLINEYKNLILGLAINAKERGIEQEAIFGDTDEHKTIDYEMLSKYQEKERVWREENVIKSLGYGIGYYKFRDYLKLKYDLTKSEANSLNDATKKFKTMVSDGVDIANANYETRKEYGLSYDEQNLYRLSHGLNRIDCNGENEPCSKIESWLDSNGTLTKSGFLINFKDLKSKAGLINARDDMANELRELLGVAPDKYKLMSFYDLAKWKISLDNIPAKDFNDSEPNWPLFNASLKYNENGNDYPWQLFALEQSAQKQECKYIKSRFFETDKAKLRDSYPPNAIDGGKKAERRFIEYTTYTWDYNRPEVWFRESEWSPNRTYYRILQDGGVCGRQSTMGQHANECLNRPSIGVGQPGHRAWVGVYNLEDNPKQYYVRIGYEVGSYESATAGIDIIYDRYTKGIRDRSIDRFAGVASGVSPANVGERVYNKSMILQHIGHILEEKGESPEAVLRKAIEIAPTNVDAWYQLSRYYAKQDEPDKSLALAKEFMDKRDSFFLDKDRTSYGYQGTSLEVVVGKTIALTALEAPSINRGKGDGALDFKAKLWNYFDKYEKEHRAYRTYGHQNRYLSTLYLTNLKDKDSFISEVKSLFDRFLNNSTSGYHADNYFKGVNWGDINKTALFDELQDMTDSAQISDSRRATIYKDILQREQGTSLAEINLNDICIDSNVSSCQRVMSFELDAKAIYITVDSSIGDSAEVAPTESGKEGYSVLTFPVVDELGNGFNIKIRMAKIDGNKLYKINDPVEVSTDKTKVIAWIDPNDVNLEDGKVYSSSSRVVLTVKKRVTNNEENMGKAYLSVKDLTKANRTLTFNKESVSSKIYKDDSTSIYFVTTNSSIGPTKGVWAKSGDALLNIKVVDDNGNIKTMVLKARNDSSWTMNSGLNASWDNTLKLEYEQDLNPTLSSGTHYKALKPITIDTRAWHKNNQLVDRFYLDVDFTTP